MNNNILVTPTKTLPKVTTSVLVTLESRKRVACTVDSAFLQSMTA